MPNPILNDKTLNEAPHTNGAYALYADEAALPLTATGVKRISSVAFAPSPPVALLGTLTNTLSGEVRINFDDPTNPFLHRYHPLHDNQDADFKPYTNAVETRTIVRQLTLNFSAVTNATAHPLWGVDAVLGTARARGWREELGGLKLRSKPEGADWYPYDILSNVDHLANLLGPRRSDFFARLAGRSGSIVRR